MLIALLTSCAMPNISYAADDYEYDYDKLGIDKEEPMPVEVDMSVLNESDSNYSDDEDASSPIQIHELEDKIDAIDDEAEQAYEEQIRILKPQVPKVDYSKKEPSNSYASGSYVSPYKSDYDDPYSYTKKAYAPPKPTVDSYEAYLEKYRKQEKNYTPYLSGASKPIESYEEVKKPVSKPSYTSDAYSSPTVKPLTPYPSSSYEAPIESTAKAEPTMLKAQAVDEVQRENIKQNIFKNAEDISKLQAPEKKPELVKSDDIEPAVIESSSAGIKSDDAPTQKLKFANITKTEKPAKPVTEKPIVAKTKIEKKAETVAKTLSESPEKYVDTTIPSIFNQPAKTDDVMTADSTARDISANNKPEPEAEEADVVDNSHIILDRNIPMPDEVIPDITKGASLESKTNDVVAEKDITSSHATNITSHTVPEPKEAISEITKVASADTSKPASVTEASAIKPAYEEEAKETKPVVAAEPEPIKEITKPNIYAQKAIESMGDKAKNTNSITQQATISKAKSILQSLGDNIEEITSKATGSFESKPDSTKTEVANITKPTSNVASQPNVSPLAKAESTPAPSSDDANKKVSPIEPKEVLTSLMFDKDSSELSPTIKAELDNTAAFLMQSPNIRVQIQAYSHSENQSKSDARRMSLSRGLMVRSYLTDKGIKPVRLDIRALGDNTEKRPQDRVDIVFLD